MGSTGDVAPVVVADGVDGSGSTPNVERSGDVAAPGADLMG
jgi:hypothetical protein